MRDNWLPIVGAILNRAYHDQRREYVRQAAEIGVVADWPKRRTSRRKPHPGRIDGADQEA